MTAPKVTRTGDRTYRVEIDGQAEVVYVAGTGEGRWAFWRGEVFREPGTAERDPVRPRQGDRQEAVTAPMPATVVTVAVEAGAAVKRGDTLMVLEAMKMELPLRASGDAVVKAVHCREGELVQPDSVLIEFEEGPRDE